MTGAEGWAFVSVAENGSHTAMSRDVAVEHPCAIEVNGLGYAVMMLSPSDLQDFAYGFCLSERLIDGAADIGTVEPHGTASGTILRVNTRPALRNRVFERVRHRLSESSCGLCGIENLEQALRPLPRLQDTPPIAPGAIFRALSNMRANQPLNGRTGAVHAAMACDGDGAILLAREDVGRHNAFDKLIGAMLRDGQDWKGRFALLSSRCSYELVEKAALAGCSTLVTVSAATELALSRAKEANIEVCSLARRDSFLACA
ncbi:formate dehydrogenase accessory sulfurtransferase FdhD [Sphingomonas sp.]|jgi:FdhD protein|uniref:formate dehydrogenase accessory sulfurtransferase FdhD n=1 Tax=Sphingomonas sp. TaxID=28214 RepID=UPI002DE95AD7|nr:formate dehydrogenase accessory sulfurtransferase FdhD [Sphingomonas sp.]HEV2567099.1 formate dehydrogenase accessory sulfurtransferase FdhD [Sphingomonas sp.]